MRSDTWWTMPPPALVGPLLAASPDCIYVFDLPTNRLVYRNRTLHGVLGYLDEEIECPRAVIPQQLMHDEDTQDPRALMDDLRELKAGSVHAVEFRMRDKTNVWRHFRSRITCLDVDANGKTRRILGLISDVTAEKAAHARAEEAVRVAERENAAKSRFLAQTSHEIRTPLNGVIGGAQLLLGTELNAEQREYVSTVWRSSEALLAIVDTALDMAKIEAGVMTLAPGPFDLVELIENAAQALAEKAAAKGLAFSLRFAGELPPKFYGDCGRIRQVLLNLLGNAVKFTERGTVQVRADVTPIDGKRHHIVISVKDTGPGIAAEVRSRLFQKFAPARPQGGSGLGLAISRQLMGLMGGKLMHSDPEGGGCEFLAVLELPTAVDGTQLAVHTPLASNVLKGKRVFLVGDDATSLDAWRDRLRRWGAIVVLAVPGKGLTIPKGMDLVVIDRHGKTGTCADPAAWIAAAKRASPEARVILATPLDAELARYRRWESAGSIDLCLPQPLAPTRLKAFLERGRDQGPKLDAYGAPNQRAGKGLVLVVDDHEENRRVVSRLVEKAGFKVKVACSGAEAVDFATRHKPNLIFMDCQMPEMDGLTATRQIRKDNKDPELRIVALTADVFQADRDACHAAGMDEVLLKPLRFEELRRCLGTHLKEKAR